MLGSLFTQVERLLQQLNRANRFPLVECELPKALERPRACLRIDRLAKRSVKQVLCSLTLVEPEGDLCVPQ